jgi:hypothetical protein
MNDIIGFLICAQLFSQYGYNHRKFRILARYVRLYVRWYLNIIRSKPNNFPFPKPLVRFAISFFMVGSEWFCSVGYL